MSKNPIRGKTFSFTFEDGPMAGKSFEHRFDEDGMVTFRPVGDGKPEAGEQKAREPGVKYEVAVVRDDVCAVSYRSAAGYTLSVVLDFASKTLVAFSSNDKMLALQHGSFREMPAAAGAKREDGARSGAPRH